MARLLNGSSDQLVNATTPGATTPPLTLAAWFKPDIATARMSVIGLDNTGSSNSWFHLELQGDQVGDPLAARQSGDIGDNAALSTTGFSTAAWQHGCAVFASNASRAVYLNGANKGTNTGNSGSGGAAPNQTSIGKLQGSFGSFQRFDGAIAELAVWNAALTDEEAAALAKGVSPLLIRPASLVFYAPLLAGASPEQDLRGRRELTVTGATAADHPPVLRPPRAWAWKPSTGGTSDETVTWSILRDVYVGIDRFDRIQADLGISRKVLTERLKWLVESGVLERRQYQDRPPRDEYVLTDKGTELVDLLMVMVAVGRPVG